MRREYLFSSGISKYQILNPIYFNDRYTEYERRSAGRVIGLGLIDTSLAITGALWTKHHIITSVQYTDNVSTEPQLIAFGFGDGIQKVQPLIYDKMQKAKADNN